MELLFIETEQKYCETLLLREKIYIYILEKKLPLSYHFRLAIQILLPSQKNWFFLNHFSHLVFSNMLLSAMYNYLYFQHDCVFVFYPKQNDFPTILWKILLSRVPYLVTYPGRLGARYTGLGAQTLAPKKGFLTFYLKIFFKHPRRRVFRYSIYVI